jgi:hypothetical protein
MSTRAELIAGYTYGDDTPYWMLISQADRDKAAASGAAMPDGSYPVKTCDGENSVSTAIDAVGRGSGSHNAIRKHIITRAKSLGCSSKIPDNWNADGSLSDSANAAPTVALAALRDQASFAPAVQAAIDLALASLRYSAFAPPPPPPAEPAKPPAAPPAQAPPLEGDALVDKAVATLKTAVTDAIAAQTKDPDAKTDPADAKVMGTLENIASLVEQLDVNQAKDEAGAEPPAAPDAPPAAPADQSMASKIPPAAKIPPPGTPNKEPATKPNPVDADGNVAPGAICTVPECGHVAAVHTNTDDGDNTGACATPGCTCPGMAVEAGDIEPDVDQPPGDDGEPGPEQLAGGIPLPMPVDGPAPTSATEESNPAPAIPGGDLVGPAFTIPVGVIEGQPTGDGRQIAVGSLTWRTPPMPLMFQKTTAHDPSGMSPNDPAVLAGRIDELSRVGGENGTAIIMAKGFFLTTKDGVEAAEIAEQMGRVGISADIAAQAEEVQITDTDGEGWPVETESTLTEGVIMGFTMLPFPAFAAAYIILGDGEPPPAIPQQAGDAIAASGQLIHLMSFEECEVCDPDIEVLVASAAGPERPPAAWFSDPAFEPGDGRLIEIYSRDGRREGRYACPVTVTAAGQIYGHLAPFGVCHEGFPGKCILAPRSKAGYAFFKRAGYITSAEGERINVGVLTAATTHAALEASASGAMKHYEDTGWAAADVNVGEDEHGIWIAGAVRPNATDAQIRALTAAAPSGDWRPHGAGHELVAVLCVNQPGFPIVPAQALVAGGRVGAIVAVGTSVMHALAHPAQPETVTGDMALRIALAPLLEQQATAARDRIAAVR